MNSDNSDETPTNTSESNDSTGGFPAIHESVLWQIARDIATNVREDGWDEDMALSAMYNLTEEAKKHGPISTIREAYDRAMVKKRHQKTQQIVN